MPKRRSHSESAWERLGPHKVRCQATRPNGGQCRREAENGSVVCDIHGGAAPQVRRRAAERIVMTADAAAEAMIKLMNDTAVPYGVRVKVMQDLLDRGGLAAAQVHKVMPVQEDPVEALFQSILDDPEGLAPPTSDTLALPAGQTVEGTVVDSHEDALDRLNDSWTPDAEVHPLPPERFGTPGPYAMRPPAEPDATKKSPVKIPKHIRDGLDIA